MASSSSKGKRETANPERVRHGRLDLALFQLAERVPSRGGHPLLLVHDLGGRSPVDLPAECQDWPGDVFALDLSGHGASGRGAGGGYSAEVLMADLDAALAVIGPATVMGNGLGAFLALLVAGSRPELVRGAVLSGGRGLAGGGPEPAPVGTLVLVDQETAKRAEVQSVDPFALLELSSDVRPPGYARMFARQAAFLSPYEKPIAVCVVPEERPPWLVAVAEHEAAVSLQVAEALALFSEPPSEPSS